MNKLHIETSEEEKPGSLWSRLTVSFRTREGAVLVCGRLPLLEGNSVDKLMSENPESA